MKTRHDVASPTAIHLRDWWAIVVRVFWRVLQDNLGLLAAGISFYAFLSIFPAIAAALMVWGIFTDTISLGAQLETLRELAPEAFNLVADQMVVIAMQDDGGLTIGVLVSALFAFWGASGAVAALIQAMNMGYHEEEKRSFIKLNALTLTFTFCGILFVVMSIIAIAAAPPILKALSLGSFVEAAINSVRWLVIIALFMAACAAIYRIAPSRDRAGALALDHSGRGWRRRDLDGRLDRILALSGKLRGLQRHVWISRRRCRPADVVLDFGFLSMSRGRAERAARVVHHRQHDDRRADPLRRTRGLRRRPCRVAGGYGRGPCFAEQGLN
jgi:uncharacterized BrkB/YihY/UPF0761 family membrane protein